MLSDQQVQVTPLVDLRAPQRRADPDAGDRDDAASPDRVNGHRDPRQLVLRIALVAFFAVVIQAAAISQIRSSA